MRFDLSDIPRPPQTTGTRTLGNRPFNARAFGIAFFKLRRVFALASPLQDVILRARFETQGAWPSRCAGALGPSSTGLATRCGKADVDPRMARFVLAIGPNATDLALGTRHPALVPIDGKARDIKPFACLRLPGRIHPHWPNNLDVILLLTVNENIGVDVPAIH